MARTAAADEAAALKCLTFQWKETDQGKATNKTKTWGNITV